MRRTFFYTVLAASFGFGASANEPTQEEFQAMSQAERQSAKLASVRDSKRFEGQLRTGIKVAAGPTSQRAAAKASMGTITYDTGTFSAVPTQPAGITDTLSFGNQFDTQNGQPIPAPSVTVTQIALWPALVNGSSTASGAAFVTIFGPVNTAGTNASALNSVNQASIQPQAWNTVAQSAVISPTTGTATAASFLIGVFGGASGGTGTDCDGDCIALDTSGTVNGQGFHAMRIDDFGGGDFGTIAGANALIRPMGNVVPVELMNFSIQ